MADRSPSPRPYVDASASKDSIRSGSDDRRERSRRHSSHDDHGSPERRLADFLHFPFDNYMYPYAIFIKIFIFKGSSIDHSTLRSGPDLSTCTLLP